ncbi:hypothetical protein HDU96_008830, partial [Phlyctochytrium bullatum]
MAPSLFVADTRGVSNIAEDEETGDYGDDNRAAQKEENEDQVQYDPNNPTFVIDLDDNTSLRPKAWSDAGTFDVQGTGRG